jgi:hypothetical protein
MKNVLLAAAAALFIAGGLLFYGSVFTKNFISEQLSAQQISFPSKEQLVSEGRSDLSAYAGKQVTTGAQAKAFASYIEGHLAKVANGQTYSQVSAQYLKNTSDQKLSAQRQTLFMGETLRGILLNTWGWSLVGLIAFYAALGLWAAAVAVLAVYILLTTNTKKPVKRTNKKK